MHSNKAGCPIEKVHRSKYKCVCVGKRAELLELPADPRARLNCLCKCKVCRLSTEWSLSVLMLRTYRLPQAAGDDIFEWEPKIKIYRDNSQPTERLLLRIFALHTPKIGKKKRQGGEKSESIKTSNATCYKHVLKPLAELTHTSLNNLQKLFFKKIPPPPPLLFRPLCKMQEESAHTSLRLARFYTLLQSILHQLKILKLNELKK